MPRLAFWYEFASPYSYLSAMRLDAEAAKAGVETSWKPFLLGPIFQAQGWDTSPFVLYPAKGRYMVRDVSRIATARGLPFQMPKTFPARSLKAARLALLGQDEGWAAPFSRAVFAAGFAHGEDISADAVLTRAAEAAGQDYARLLQCISDPGHKARLRAQTAEAAALGVFGAPAFVCSGNELFWGDDRLDQAVAWQSRLNAAGSPLAS